MIICDKCGEDINEKNQDNVSIIPGVLVCEDCAREMTESDWEKMRDDIDNFRDCTRWYPM